MNIKKIMLKAALASLMILTIASLFCCQKDEAVGTVDIAKVNVINAVVDGGAVKVNVSNKTLAWSSIADAQILGGTNNLNRLYTVSTDMSTYLKVAPFNDTTTLWYDQMKQFNEGKMYTLYLSGTPSNVKTLFHEEMNFPKPIIRDAGRRTPVTDSIVNIRFVNLSPSGPKVDINIQGKNSNEISDLSYEAFTDFKVYPAISGTYSIAFEIRRSTDKQLIGTYYLNADYFRFKSVAVVLMGIYDPDWLLTLPYTDRYRIETIAYQ